jgi:hypothetical protein
MTAVADWRPIVRALEYPTLFTADPLDDVDRILAMVVGGQMPTRSLSETIEAITMALASDDDLTTLNGVWDNRPGRQLRPFLAALKAKLEQARRRSTPA